VPLLPNGEAEANGDAVDVLPKPAKPLVAGGTEEDDEEKALTAELAVPNGDVFEVLPNPDGIGGEDLEEKAFWPAAPVANGDAFDVLLKPDGRGGEDLDEKMFSPVLFVAKGEAADVLLNPEERGALDAVDCELSSATGLEDRAAPSSAVSSGEWRSLVTRLNSDFGSLLAGVAFGLRLQTERAS